MGLQSVRLRWTGLLVGVAESVPLRRGVATPSDEVSIASSWGRVSEPAEEAPAIEPRNDEALFVASWLQRLRSD
jgi:hypothetical protein